ncbi:hypothetical protein TRFO_38426 [Tritrichomonas foetus]|uniref:U3 small nucleolar RNA-associated protein 25 n=1 Tax=Tritrichomonas foetus TaxID=1144522 RepID=A0A1J4J8F7_9EUKA|nr:hypothetical protein TRFO_38426 [Tritrichomonas foetus]|eukprot:OHS95474.1 hypothetical protein TRFO_38426 [Tritrichomonas foetus]
MTIYIFKKFVGNDDHDWRIIFYKMKGKRRTQKKRSANDFLAMLSTVVVQAEDDQNEEKGDIDAAQKAKEDLEKPVDVTSDLETLKVEGSPISFNEWFNNTEHNFFADKPELKIYKSEFGLALSTSDIIPSNKIITKKTIKAEAPKPKPTKRKNSKKGKNSNTEKVPENTEEFIEITEESNTINLFKNLNGIHDNIEITKDSLAPSIFDYRDFMYVGKENARFRKIAALHVVNHIYRDFEAKENRPSPDFKDSNFTPSVILVLCPHKLQAYQFITDVIKCLPDKVTVKNEEGNEEEQQFQIENFDKLAEYTVDKISEHYLRTRAADWLETFGGNSDSDFKTGIRFFHNKVSLFQGIAKSQLVIASPLALSLFEEKNFLSSIEILVLDSIDVLTMQHSDRLAQIILQLNTLPKTVDQTDWSRLRPYCANNNHRKMRQNIGYGAILSPEIFNQYQKFENIRGQLIIRPLIYPRALQSGEFERTYKKMNSGSIDKIGEAIYKTFKEKLFPLIKQWRSEDENVAKRTIIYFVSSFRFFQARKMLEDDLVNYLELSDESTKQDSSNMKKAFRSDPNAVLLLTERHYFYFRPKLEAGRVIFMQPPSYPHFATELAGKCDATIYFTEFDELALERVAGSEFSPKVIANDLYTL